VFKLEYKEKRERILVVYTCNPSTQEAGESKVQFKVSLGYITFGTSLGYLSETLSQKKQIDKKTRGL
jgi:hypothetical protein